MIKQTKDLMGMPITVEVVDAAAKQQDAEAVFEYFKYIDEKFSTYKDNSEISRINRGQIKPESYSEDMKTVFALSEATKNLTNGYFDIVGKNGLYDPSGLVKGWAIETAAKILQKRGFKNFYVEAGGDIQTAGTNQEGKVWSVGIKNPFNQKEIVKVVYISDLGMATSGTYIRGQHIYDPHNHDRRIEDIVSLTVIGPNVYEADRFATAAFAMGREGINFIQHLDVHFSVCLKNQFCDYFSTRLNNPKQGAGFTEKLKDFEGYMIDSKGIATMTSGFEKYSE